MSSLTRAHSRDESSKPAVLQCATCRTIVSDSTYFVGSLDPDGDTLSLREVSMIDVAREALLSQSGWDSGCLFHAISCRGCQATVGRHYVSTSRDRVELLETYTVASSAMISYQLGMLPPLHADGAVDRTNGYPAGHDERNGGAARGSERPYPSGNSNQEGMKTGPSHLGQQQASPLPPQHQNKCEPVEHLSCAVVELDRHTAALTTAVNKLTFAHQKSMTDMNAIDDRISVLSREVHGHLGELSSQVVNLDKEVMDCEKLMVTWETRFKKLESAVFPGMQHQQTQPARASQALNRDSASVLQPAVGRSPAPTAAPALASTAAPATVAASTVPAPVTAAPGPAPEAAPLVPPSISAASKPRLVAAASVPVPDTLNAAPMTRSHSQVPTQREGQENANNEDDYEEIGEEPRLAAKQPQCASGNREGGSGSQNRDRSSGMSVRGKRGRATVGNSAKRMRNGK
jgi:Yippee zinc-binding/DNA-binding /Mis18, centromere assembly